MKQDKTILFITGALTYGGAGKMMIHVAGICAREYKHVYAVALNPDDPICTIDNGVKFLPTIGIHGSGLKGRYKTIKAIRSVVKKIKPDILVTFVSEEAFCSRIATLGMRNLIVVSAERGNPYADKKYVGMAIRWAFNISDWCFFQLEHAMAFYGNHIVKKSFVIPNAAFFNGTLGSHKAKRKTIVTAGRFVPEKGFEYLIEAFKIVYEKYPEYHLIIHGDGFMKNEYKLLVSKLGLTDVVEFPGYSNDVAAAFTNEEIFALPSLAEGIPNILIEALLVGIPTVSTDCLPGGPRFLTDNGKNGIIVPVANKEALADGIIKLIEDKELYRKFEEEGPKIINKLSLDVVEKQWIDAFRKITSK